MTEDLEEMGPIDYIVVEWPQGKQPSGEAAPILVELVESGLIRLIDITFLAKGEDGSVSSLDLETLAEASPELKELVGASSDLLTEDDEREAAQALEPGTTAAILVYENRWAGPFAAAVRGSGAQLVSSGRIPPADFVAALDAAEAAGA